MDDGIDEKGILCTCKEIVSKALSVKDRAVEYLWPNETDELPAYPFVCGGQSLGFCIAVIDRDAEMLL